MSLVHEINCLLRGKSLQLIGRFFREISLEVINGFFICFCKIARKEKKFSIIRSFLQTALYKGIGGRSIILPCSQCGEAQQRGNVFCEFFLCLFYFSDMEKRQSPHRVA